MTRRPCFYTPGHPFSFRPGETALVVGVEMVDPNGEGDARPCFHLIWPDGAEDWSPVYDTLEMPEGRWSSKP